MKHISFNICDIYASLYLIQYTKGVLFDSDFVSVILYILLTAISLYYAVVCITETHNPPVVKVYNVLFLLLAFYGSVNLLMGDVNSYVKIPKDFYLQNVTKSMLPFYAFYAFAKMGMITKKWLCTFTVVFLAITVGRYYSTEIEIIEQLGLNAESGEVTNNIGYVFVSILPLCCFFDKRQILQFLLILVCCAYILISMKRGAIFVAIVCLVYFFMKNMTHKFGWKKLITISLTISLFIVGYRFVLNMMDSNVFFMQRVEDTMHGYSSGRDDLYGIYWKMFWNDSNLIEMLIGHGADGTIRSGHNYAHNDWLEILINQGVIGVIIFFFFWVRLFQLWWKIPKSIIGTALGMCLAVIFLKTFFSMSINDMTVCSTCVLGIGVAAYYDSKILKKITL